MNLVFYLAPQESCEEAAPPPVTEANSVVAENDVGSGEVNSQEAAEKGELTRFQCESPV